MAALDIRALPTNSVVVCTLPSPRINLGFFRNPYVVRGPMNGIISLRNSVVTRRKFLKGIVVEFRNLLVLVCFALCRSVSAMDGVKSPTHCKPDEKVIFSCPFKNGKTVSLCASPDLSKDVGTLQYRYGRIGRTPELSYPQPVGHPRNYFGFNSSHGGHWAQYELSFSISQFKYELSIQTNSAISEYGASLDILRNSHRETDMECRFERSINNIWSLEELGIRPTP